MALDKWTRIPPDRPRPAAVVGKNVLAGGGLLILPTAPQGELETGQGSLPVVLVDFRMAVIHTGVDGAILVEIGGRVRAD